MECVKLQKLQRILFYCCDAAEVISRWTHVSSLFVFLLVCQSRQSLSCLLFNCLINCDVKPQTFISIFNPDSRSLKESRAKHVNYINCVSKTTTSSSTPSLPLWCWEAAGAMEGKAQRIMGEWAKTQGGSRQMKWSGNDDDDDDVCGLKEQFTTNENHFMSVQIKTDA